MEKLLCAVPFSEIRLGSRFFLEECFHFFLGKKVVAVVNRLIANAESWNLTEWLASALDKNVCGIYQVGVNVRDMLALSTREDGAAFCCAIIAEADDDTMHMGFLLALAVPDECAVGEIDMDARGEQRFPENRDGIALRNRVRRDESRMDACTFHVVSG